MVLPRLGVLFVLLRFDLDSARNAAAFVWLSLSVMAKQTGIIKLKGTIGDITFYKTKDGHLARQKGGVDRDRIMNDPKFQRTRENASEFGRAGKASKVLCTAIRPVLNKTQDSRMISRLVKKMMEVIKADVVSTRGQRNVLDGELILLQGFDFNNNASLSSTLYFPVSVDIMRSVGFMEIGIPRITPDKQISAPSGTTHFRFISAGVEVDFENETFVFSQASTEEIAYDNSETIPYTLANETEVEDSTKPLFVVFGIEFLQQVNGSFYSLNNGAYNALNLITVDTGV